MLAAAALVTAVLAAVAVAVTHSTDDDLTAGPPSAACPPGVDTLAFTVDASVRDEALFDGYSSVGVVRTDRPEDVTYLNGDPGQVVIDPSIAPTGERVALTWADGDYESSGPASESVWTSTADGTDVRPLTTGTNDRTPRWSPDGRWIVFVGVDDSTSEWREVVSLVPAEGGPVRRLATFEEGWRSVDTVWRPDSSGVVVVGARAEVESENGTVVALGLDGERRDVAEVSGWTESLTMVPGGEEVMVGVTDGRHRRGRVAVDLSSGEQRPIGGPGGELRWSPDGQRAYVLLRDDEARWGDLHRVLYDGSDFVLGDDIPIPEGATGFDVGPCVEPPPTGPVEDRPLIGTTWTLGPREATVTEREPVDGCEPGSCTPVRIERREQVWDPPGHGGGDGAVGEGSTEETPSVPVPATVASPDEPPADGHTTTPGPRVVVCAVYEGEVRGTRLSAEAVPDSDESTRCAWDIGPPETLEVDGNLLRVAYGSEHGHHTVTYGALFVGDAPEPVDDPGPAGPVIDEVEATTTTVPPPETAPCDDVVAFADALAATDVRSDLPPASSPEELAGRARLVVRGELTGSDLTTWVDGPGGLSLANDVVVTEVLAADPGVDVEVGADIGVVYSFRAVSGAMPPLGEDSSLPAGDGTGKPDGAVPVIAFLTDEGAPHGTWQIDGPDALAVGCPGEPLGGLTGEGPGWADVDDIEDLADRVRHR